MLAVSVPLLIYRLAMLAWALGGCSFRQLGCWAVILGVAFRGTISREYHGFTRPTVAGNPFNLRNRLKAVNLRCLYLDGRPRTTPAGLRRR